MRLDRGGFVSCREIDRLQVHHNRTHPTSLSFLFVPSPLPLCMHRSELPTTYQTHLKTIATRVAIVDELVPEMRPTIRVPIDLQDETKLHLVAMADGALLYRRAKIKVAMSQTEVGK